MDWRSIQSVIRIAHEVLKFGLKKNSKGSQSACMSNEISNSYEFLEYRLDAANCHLWRDGELVPLAPKALELLCLLVSHKGDVVSKQKIFDTVWAGTFVEEGVLTQNIYVLRQTLGNEVIENIARRGYRFSVPVVAFDSTDQEIVRSGSDSREYIIATETRTELIDEFEEQSARPRLSGPTRSLKRRTAVFLGAGLLVGLIFAVAGVRYLPGVLWSVTHRPPENLVFLRVTDSGNVQNATLSPDGDIAAFVRDGGIFLKDINSGKEIRLETPNQTKFGSLRFSPDGGSLIFRNSATPYRTANVMQVSRFGGEAKIIAEKSWLTIAISRDGLNLALIRNIPEDKRQVLVVKNLVTGDEREILSRNYPETFSFRGDLSWSPDGTRISFIANSGADRTTRLFVADVASGKSLEIENPKLRRIENAIWHPDGDSLIAVAGDTATNLQLWRIRYPGGETQRLTNGLGRYGRIALSSDGRRLLAIRTDEHSNIAIADADDLSAPVEITKGNANHFGQSSLDWIDNERIVFSSSEEKNPVTNLWTVNATDGTRLPLTSNSEFHSDFAKTNGDGHTVYFNSNRGRIISVWRIDATGENVTEIVRGSDGLRLFPVVSPDGNSVYYLFRNRQESTVRRFDLAQKRETAAITEKDLVPAAFLSISKDGKYLAFLNLVNEIATEDSENNYQVAVASVTDAGKVRLFNIQSTRPFAAFSAEPDSFDYLSVSPKGSRLVRQPFSGEAREILNLNGSWIYNFAWSKDGRKLALSMGTRTSDAVLIENLE